MAIDQASWDMLVVDQNKNWKECIVKKDASLSEIPDGEYNAIINECDIFEFKDNVVKIKFVIDLGIFGGVDIFLPLSNPNGLNLTRKQLEILTQYKIEEMDVVKNLIKTFPGINVLVDIKTSKSGFKNLYFKQIL